MARVEEDGLPAVGHSRSQASRRSAGALTGRGTACCPPGFRVGYVFLFHLVIELQIEAEWLDVRRSVGRHKQLLRIVPCVVHDFLFGCRGWYAVVCDVESADVRCRHVVCHVVAVSGFDSDGAVGVCQHVRLHVAAVAHDHPGVVGPIADGRGRLGERQLVGIADVQLVLAVFHKLMIVQRPVAGDTVEVERKHPLLQTAHGSALIDYAADLDVAGTYEWNAVGDGEFTECLANADTQGIAAHDDAGRCPIEYALSKDGPVVEGSTGHIGLFLVSGGISSTDPDAVGDLGITLGTQRTPVRSILIRPAYQFARSRTVVNTPRLGIHLVGNGCNAVHRSVRRRDSRYPATEVTVADGALVVVGYSGTVNLGFYVSHNAQSFEHSALPDFLEQALATFSGIVPDGVTVTPEMTIQRHFPGPVVQVDVPAKDVCATLVADSAQLLGSVDERANLRLEGDQHIVGRHGEREFINVFGIVVKRAVLSVAAIGC